MEGRAPALLIVLLRPAVTTPATPATSRDVITGLRRCPRRDAQDDDRDDAQDVITQLRVSNLTAWRGGRGKEGDAEGRDNWSCGLAQYSHSR